MNAQILEEASEWIVRNRDGRLDADSRSRFDAWLRRSPVHVQAYLEMSSVWETLPELRAGKGPATDALVAELRQMSNSVVPLQEFGPRRADRSDSSLDTSTQPATRSPTTRLLPFAASLLAAVAGVWLYTARGTYEAGVGEQRTVVLEDGSRMELNSRTRVRVLFTDAERRIDLLEGQALFDVAKNPVRPFVVKSGAAYVRAVGTQFDVYRRPEGTVVTVVEGKVAVMPPPRSGSASTEAGGGESSPTEVRRPLTREVFIGAGEQVTVQKAAAPERASANVSAATAWTRGMLLFEAAPLTEVAAEFNRYNRRQIVLTGPIPDAISVSGAFSSSDPDVLLRFLGAQPELSIHAVGGEIRISSR